MPGHLPLKRIVIAAVAVTLLLLIAFGAATDVGAGARSQQGLHDLEEG